MRKFSITLGVIFVISIVFVSCGPGGASGNGGPIATKLTISATAPASKVWYGSASSGTVGTNIPATITASPGTVSGSTYTVENVTGLTDVKLFASGSGQTAETTVTVDSWGQSLSLLCKNSTWHGTTQTIGGGTPTPWTTYHFTFGVNGKYVFNGSFNSGGSDAPAADYTFNEVANKITFGGQTWDVVTLTETNMALSRTNADGKLVVTNYIH